MTISYGFRSLSSFIFAAVLTAHWVLHDLCCLLLFPFTDSYTVADGLFVPSGR
jgi:hypothetical protein